MGIRRQLVKKVQKVFWIYLAEIFVVAPTHELARAFPKVACELIPISDRNCDRVMDFREKDVATEFLQKIRCGQVGLFAVHKGQIVGSIWATINSSTTPKIARGFVRLMPKEALIHDIVTSAKYRGLGIGGFMLTGISRVLFRKHEAVRIIVDVNVRNASSLKMMRNTGVEAKHRCLSISIFQRPVFVKILSVYG